MKQSWSKTHMNGANYRYNKVSNILFLSDTGMFGEDNASWKTNKKFSSVALIKIQLLLVYNKWEES